MYKPSHPAMVWLDEKLPLPRFVFNAVGAGYPVPRNLNYMWNFGVLAGFCLIQIVTGVILAMHYAANTGVAFDSTEHIMRDVNWGWMLRYGHANGASLLRGGLCPYLPGFLLRQLQGPARDDLAAGRGDLPADDGHGLHGLCAALGPDELLGRAGHHRPVQRHSAGGRQLHTWLLGGFAPDQAALNRFFSLHFLLPFVILGVVILHIWALHIPGSSNPTGVEVKSESDTVPFHPYYTAKDGFGLAVFLFLYCAMLFFFPNALGHPDNYIPANPMQTPAHIVPEWYFWPFYAILRAFTALPSPSPISCWSRPSCWACWRCSARSWCGSRCPGWIRRRCVRAISAPPSASSTGCW
jgi:ubiquinol-cytochrome c reductase cytochrome b subunit